MRVTRGGLRSGFSRQRRCRVPSEPIFVVFGWFFLLFFIIYYFVCIASSLYFRSGWGIGLGGKGRDVCIYYDGQGYPAIVSTALFTARV